MQMLTSKVRQALKTQAGKYVCKQAYAGAKRDVEKVAEYEGLYSGEKELEKAIDKRVKSVFAASYKDHWPAGTIDTFIKQAKSRQLPSEAEEE